MSLIPIRKAFDTSTRSSAYIFSCPHRKFPVIMQYESLKSLAEINDMRPVRLLLERQDFDSIECGVSEGSEIWELVQRGYTVSGISQETGLQPLEVAVYYSGLASPDDETLKMILERTRNADIPIAGLQYVNGEPAGTL